jgi:hypothetical protein
MGLHACINNAQRPMTDFMHKTKKTKGILNFLMNLNQMLQGPMSAKAVAPLYAISSLNKKVSKRTF